MCLFKAFVDFYLWSRFFLFSVLFFNQHATFLDFKMQREMLQMLLKC